MRTLVSYREVMASYALGMRVIIRNEEWMILKAVKNTLGKEALYCIGISPLVKGRDMVFLADLEKDIQVVDPKAINLIVDKSNQFMRSMLFVESIWRQQIPTDSKLHIGHNAAMDTMDYQLIPASMALKKYRQRILIADAVGLGKTLEAGILMSELIARGKGRRILVVTVKSMMTQFQKEMWNRFTIPLVRLDSQKIHTIRRDLPSTYNPFNYYAKTIISIDTLKRDIDYRTHLEKAYWDIIVIDEAHNVAERGNQQAQRSRLASLLAERSDTMIMLSATPHDGRAKSFASLMLMLDPTTIADPNNYEKEDIKGLCIRRFKKDLNLPENSFKERQVTTQNCQASAKEEIAFNTLAQMKLVMDDNKNKAVPGMLFKTLLFKSLLSSPVACLQTVEGRIKRLENKDSKSPDIPTLENFKTQLEAITASDFSRYQALLALLNSKEYGWSRAKDDRVVIFTERIATKKFLAEHLPEDLDGIDKKDIATISGDMDDMEQQEVVENFGRSESPVRILIASDVASEGINLHYLSHRLIHFDIPWSLMVFQQRNGRIDRYGQTKTPDIRYLLTRTQNQDLTNDISIIKILVEKEDQAFKNIGDPSLLFNEFTQEGEEKRVYNAMEGKMPASEFSNNLSIEAVKEGKCYHDSQASVDTQDTDDDDFVNLFDIMNQSADDASADEQYVQTCEEKTFFRDDDYLEKAIKYFNANPTSKEQEPISCTTEANNLKIKLTASLNKRLKSLLPPEAVPSDYLQLSTDKNECMRAMQLSMQLKDDENKWPDVQYLWKLHPIFTWINDRSGLLFKRGEAPLLRLPSTPNTLQPNEVIFIIMGSIPNRRSIPVVDTWFATKFVDNKFQKIMTMEDVIENTGLGKQNLPNIPNAGNEDEDLATVLALRSEAIEQAKLHIESLHVEYDNTIEKVLNDELDKLASLKDKHKEHIKAEFNHMKKHKIHTSRNQEAETKSVGDMFDKFEQYVTNSMQIENTPYIRIVAALKGVAI